MKRRNFIGRLVILCLLFAPKLLWSQDTVLRMTDADLKKTSEVVVLNYGDDYQYTIYVNMEPVFSGTGLSATEWTGYPLKSGTNEVQFTAVALSTESGSQVHCELTVVRAGQPSGEEWRAAFRDLTKIEKTFVFRLDDPAQQNPPFDQLGIEKGNLTNELKQCSLKIAQALGNRNADKLAELTGSDKNAVKSGYPSWFFDSAMQAKVTVVEKPEDTELLAGGRFAVVRPSHEFARQHPNAGLVAVQDAKTGAQILKNCLVFCRVNNHVCLFASRSNVVRVKL